MTKENSDNRPRPYDLSDPEELKRLLREISGYVKAGAFIYKEGTDQLGRRYAAAALHDALSQGYTLAKAEP